MTTTAIDDSVVQSLRALICGVGGKDRSYLARFLLAKGYEVLGTSRDAMSIKSSEYFGDTGEIPATEATPFSPRSPYSIAKTIAHNLVVNYREAYGLRVCTGIFFNHESPLPPNASSLRRSSMQRLGPPPDRPSGYNSAALTSTTTGAGHRRTSK